ncbi:MAG: NAD(P)/FAD-dependent oxidoreductase [Acidobacteriota bacterium]
MGSERARILIIGGGIAGLATAWHLGRRHAEGVLLLEREPQLGTHSTGRNAAILRTVGPDPLITSVALRSKASLLAPPAGFSETPLVDPCGLLMIAGRASAAELQRWAGEAGPTAQVIPASRLETLAPHFAGDTALAAWFPDEGRLDIAALVQGFARGARRTGIAFHRGATVEGLLQEGGRVAGARLAGGEEIRADTTVIASGGWAGRLGASAGSRVDLRPTRRHLMVTAPDDRVDARWPVVWSLGDAFYCRPESGGLLLCACDQVDVDPDACHTDPAIRERIAAKAMRLLPGQAGAEAAHFWCGMRTLTADQRFAIGPDPDLPGLFWVAGLGGHGMVCSFEIGRIAADLLTGVGGEDALAAALDPARLVRSAA